MTEMIGREYDAFVIYPNPGPPACLTKFVAFRYDHDLADPYEVFDKKPFAMGSTREEIHAKIKAVCPQAELAEVTEYEGNPELIGETWIGPKL